MYWLPVPRQAVLYPLKKATQPHRLMAATVVMVLPIIIVFFFAQRTFIQGIVVSGVKG